MILIRTTYICIIIDIQTKHTLSQQFVETFVFDEKMNKFIMLISCPSRHAARRQSVICAEDDGDCAGSVLCRGDLHWLQRRQGLHSAAASVLRCSETVTLEGRPEGRDMGVKISGFGEGMQ